MKRFLFTLACTFMCVCSFAKHVTAVLTSPGTLEEVVSHSGVWIYDITSLKVVGPINDKDIVFFRYLAGSESIDEQASGQYDPKLKNTQGNLEYLDLSEATITSSDELYYYARTERNDNKYERGYIIGKAQEDKISSLMIDNCISLKKIVWPNSAHGISFTRKGSLSMSRDYSYYKEMAKELADREDFSESDYYVPNIKVEQVIFGPHMSYMPCNNESVKEIFFCNSACTTSNWPQKIKIHIPNGTKSVFSANSLKSLFLEGVLVQNFIDWESDNHEDNSTSMRKTKVHIPAGATLSFDYAVSSEEDCDYLTVTVNGKKLINKSGEASGTYSGTFDNEVIGDLIIKYTKDEMSAGGSDGGYVKNITLTLPEDGLYENSYVKLGCDNYTYFDEEQFDMVIGFVAPKLTYTRTFNNTNWQALYVPFSIAYDEWKNDFEIARLNDIHQYDENDDGEIDRTELEVVKLVNGKTEANTPYVIRAKSAGEKNIVIANAKVAPIEGGGSIVSSWNTTFSFTGCYAPVLGTTMVNEGYYALGNGTLHQAVNSSSKLGSNRWYMEVTDRYGNKKKVNEVKICVFGEDDVWEETGIKPVNDVDSYASVYDLIGRKLREQNLPSGIYVKNGKKFIVK